MIGLVLIGTLLFSLFVLFLIWIWGVLEDFFRGLFDKIRFIGGTV